MDGAVFDSPSRTARDEEADNKEDGLCRGRTTRGDEKQRERGAGRKGKKSNNILDCCTRVQIMRFGQRCRGRTFREIAGKESTLDQNDESAVMMETPGTKQNGEQPQEQLLIRLDQN